MFDIGEHIVCINDKFPPLDNYINFPVKDNQYVVRDVVPAHDYNGGKAADTCAILLVGVVNPLNSKGVENGFGAWRFRRLEDLKEENSIREEKAREHERVRVIVQ